MILQKYEKNKKKKIEKNKVVDTYGKVIYELRIIDYFGKEWTWLFEQLHHHELYIREKLRATLKRGINKYRLQAFISYSFLFSNL